MSDFEAIFEWLKGCPALYELWVVSSLLEDRRNIVQLKSSANMYDVDWQPYRDGGVRYIFNPVEPYFFDVDIICYRAVYSDQNTYNLVKEYWMHLNNIKDGIRLLVRNC